MADDARLSTAFPHHPKTVKLQRRLGAEGCWHLVCLFLWVAANRPTGNLEGMTDEDIEIAAGWNGKAEHFITTLIEVHFLDGDAGSRFVHDWPEHNPWAVNRDKRIAAAKAAAAARWQCAPHTDGMRGVCDSFKTAMPTTQPNPTIKPNTSKPKSGFDGEGLTSTPNGAVRTGKGSSTFIPEPAVRKDQGVPDPGQSEEPGSASGKVVPDYLAIVLQVWDYYVITIGRNPKLYSFTDKRKRMGVARARELWKRPAEPTAEKVLGTMKYCVDRLAASPFHNGQNDRGKRYVEWEHLFRSTEQMEKWLNDEEGRK